jgi:hypothetical protein
VLPSNGIELRAHVCVDTSLTLPVCVCVCLSLTPPSLFSPVSPSLLNPLSGCLPICTWADAWWDAFGGKFKEPDPLGSGCVEIHVL